MIIRLGIDKSSREAQENAGKRTDLIEKYEGYVKDLCRVPDRGHKETQAVFLK